MVREKNTSNFKGEVIARSTSTFTSRSLFSPSFPPPISRDGRVLFLYRSPFPRRRRRPGGALLVSSASVRTSIRRVLLFLLLRDTLFLPPHLLLLLHLKPRSRTFYQLIGCLWRRRRNQEGFDNDVNERRRGVGLQLPSATKHLGRFRRRRRVRNSEEQWRRRRSRERREHRKHTCSSSPDRQEGELR